MIYDNKASSYIQDEFVYKHNSGRESIQTFPICNNIHFRSNVEIYLLKFSRCYYGIGSYRVNPCNEWSLEDVIIYGVLFMLN